MTDAALPVGPLPEDLDKSVEAIIREVGVQNLTIKTLRIRLEAKYKIDFRNSHKDEISAAVDRIMKSTVMQKELAKVQKQKDDESAQPKKKKVPASNKKESSKGGEKKKSEKGVKRPRETPKKKPSDYPKAALTAYFIFAGEKRAQVNQENPSIKITEVGSKIAALWAAESEESKSKYRELAAKDKERFAAEMAAYLENGGEKIGRSSKKSKKARKEKDPNAPKKPLGSYFIFASEQRARITAENPTLKITEIAGKIGEAWKALDEDAKKVLQEKADEDKRRYAKECAERGIALKPVKEKKKKAASASSSSSSSSGSDSSSSSSDSSSGSGSSSDSSSSDSD